MEKSLFDPGYEMTRVFLREATAHLRPGGRVVIGWGDFDGVECLENLSAEYGYSSEIITGGPSTEENPGRFILYRLRPIRQCSVAK